MSQNFKCLKNILKLLINLIICPVYLNLNRKPLGYVGIFRSSQPSISVVKGVEGWFNLVSNGGLSRSVWDSWLGFWNRCVRISGRGWGDFRPVKFCWKTCFNQILGWVRYGKIPAIHQTVGDFTRVNARVKSWLMSHYVTILWMSIPSLKEVNAPLTSIFQ